MYKIDFHFTKDFRSKSGLERKGNLFATLLFGMIFDVQGVEYIRSRRSMFGSLLDKTSKRYESTTQGTFSGTSFPLHQINDTTSHAGIEGPKNDGCKTVRSGEFCYFSYTFHGVTYYMVIIDLLNNTTFTQYFSARFRVLLPSNIYLH